MGKPFIMVVLSALCIGSGNFRRHCGVQPKRHASKFRFQLDQLQRIIHLVSQPGLLHIGNAVRQ